MRPPLLGGVDDRVEVEQVEHFVRARLILEDEILFEFGGLDVAEDLFTVEFE